MKFPSMKAAAFYSLLAIAVLLTSAAQAGVAPP
jgi:hypothetical protein